jgi:hypothetical protein
LSTITTAPAAAAAATAATTTTTAASVPCSFTLRSPLARVVIRFSGWRSVLCSHREFPVHPLHQRLILVYKSFNPLSEKKKKKELLNANVPGLL